MRNALTYLMLVFSVVRMSAQVADTVSVSEPGTDGLEIPKGKVVPMTGAFLEPLQERDSVLIADQLVYGFELKQVKEGTQLALPQWENDERGGVQVVRPWLVDTVKVSKGRKGEPTLLDIRGGMVITSFDEGVYDLPQIMVGRLNEDGVLDTLVFDPMRLEVKTMPVDTATFVPHDIKAQIRYPLTLKEVLPYVGGVLLLVLLIFLIMTMVKRKEEFAYKKKDPAHIVALRKLDRYRGNSLWAPEKQKQFYSGVTDALREYISERYGVSAMEMTTAEIFRDLKGTDIPADLLKEIHELFERADFVKFAKFVASDEDNAATLPLAVRFVTSTYQTEIEAEEASDKGGKE